MASTMNTVSKTPVTKNTKKSNKGVAPTPVVQADASASVVSAPVVASATVASAPVVSTTVASAPVVSATVVSATVASAPVVQTGASKKPRGKKAVSETVAPVVASAPVVAPVATATTPVVAKKPRGKKVVAEPTATLETSAKPTKRTRKTPATATDGVVASASAVVAPKQRGRGKKVVTEASPSDAVPATTAPVVAEDEEDSSTRSFKVQLPGNEEYVGRFTGLTPYQAANKALSKYFRENKTLKTEITFSIRESTRGSKRSTYTYNGKREKLDNPVKYSIKNLNGEAREIVKEYKNKLVKVKKTENTAEATPATVVEPSPAS